MNYLTSTTQTCLNAVGNFYQNVITHPYTDVLKTKVNEGIHFAAVWLNHGVKVIPTIPAKMQAHAGIAFGVIFTANGLFFVTMNSLTNFFNNGLNHFKPEAEMSKGQRWLRKRFFDIVVLGGSVFLFNRFGIPYATGYQLRNWVNVAVATASIFLREILRARTPSQREALRNQLNQANGERDQALLQRNNLQLQLNGANEAIQNAEQGRIAAILSRDEQLQQLNMGNLKINILENELAFEKDQLMKANTKINNLQEELDKVKEQLRKTIEEKSQAEFGRDSYQKQLEGINTTYLDLVSEFNEIKNELNSAKIELKELKDQRDESFVIE